MKTFILTMKAGLVFGLLFLAACKKTSNDNDGNNKTNDPARANGSCLQCPAWYPMM
jgi:hypothetical protein